MRICGIDIETTGLDHAKDQVTELAWVIKDVGNPKPLVAKTRFCKLPEGTLISEEIYNLTKITKEHCDHGSPLDVVLEQLGVDLERFGVQAIVAHNGENFDKPFLQAKATAGGMRPGALFDTPWLDTSVDCIYPPDCRYTNLMYVSAYFGFLNPFPHSALFDVMTTLKVLEQFDVGAVFERSKIPWIVIQALTSYDNRHLAKERRFYWETLGDKTFPKSWVKRIKASDLEKEQAACSFKVMKIDG